MAADCHPRAEWTVEAFETYNVTNAGGDTVFTPISSVPSELFTPIMMLFSRGLESYYFSNTIGFPDLSGWFRSDETGWLRILETFVTSTLENPEALPGAKWVEDPTCPESICSTHDVCEGFYRCFFEYFRGGPVKGEDQILPCMKQHALGCY